MRSSSYLLAVSIFAGFATIAVAADPVAWLPADINAVARLNVAEIYKTPLAKKEGWIKKATESFVQQDATQNPRGVVDALRGHGAIGAGSFEPFAWQDAVVTLGDLDFDRGAGRDSGAPR